MNKKTLVLVATLCALSAVTFSSELTLNQAKSIALGSSYTSQININNSEVLNTQRIDLIRAVLPNASLKSLYSPQNSGTTLSGNSISNQLSIVQPIFSSSIFMGVQGALNAKDISFDSLNQNQKTLVMSVESQYVKVLQDFNEVGVLKDQIKVNQENLKRSLALLQMNMIVKSDLLDIQYQVAQAQTILLTAQNTYDSDMLNLKNTLNIPSSEYITLVPLPKVTDDITKRDLDQDVANAENTSNVKYLNDNYAYQSSVDMGEGLSNILPTIALTGTYATGGTNWPNAFNGSWGWSYGVSLSMPIFDWGQNISAYQMAKKNVNSLKMTTQQSIDNYMLSIRTEYNTVVQYQDMEVALKVQYESAKENYAAQKERYEAGLITSIDFMTAENNMYSSQILLKNNELNLYYNYDLYMSMIQG